MHTLVLLAVLTAQSPLPDDAAFNEGLRLLEDFEYEKAIFRFREAVRDESKTPKQKAICHIYIGLTLAELREDDAAGEAFDDAIRNDPLVTLPPDASPKVKDLLEGARRRMAEEAAAAPTPDPSPDPAPNPEPDPDLGLVEPAPPSDGGGLGGIFLISGGVVAGLGGLTLVGAAVPGYLALDLFNKARDAQFGFDAAALNQQSVTMQIVAGSMAGAGVVLLASGGVLIALGVME
jgi:tetratricopeptide (TPR) repeat protein